MVDSVAIFQLAKEKEFYRLKVGLTLGGTAVNPTTLSAEYAFMPLGDKPTPSDWKPAFWATEHGQYISRILIGGEGSGADVELVGGDLYDVWWALSSPPESMVRKVGQARAA